MNLEHVLTLFREGREQVGSRLGGCRVKERNRFIACWVQVRRQLGADWEGVRNR